MAVSRSPRRSVPRSAVLAPAALALIASTAVAGVYLTLVRTPAGREWVQNAVFGRWPQSRGPLAEFPHRVDLLGSALLVGLGALVVGLAVVRGRRGPVVVVACAGVCAVATTQLLKAVVEAQDWLTGYPVSFPSGHTTAAAALAMGSVLLSPPPWRAGVAFAAFAAAAAVGLGTITAGWHNASDVAGGMLVSLAWMAAAAAIANGVWGVPVGAPPVPAGIRAGIAVLAGLIALAMSLLAVELEADGRRLLGGPEAVSANAVGQAFLAAAVGAACVGALAVVQRNVDLTRSRRPGG